MSIVKWVVLTSSRDDRSKTRPKMWELKKQPQSQLGTYFLLDKQSFSPFGSDSSAKQSSVQNRKSFDLLKIRLQQELKKAHRSKNDDEQLRSLVLMRISKKRNALCRAPLSWDQRYSRCSVVISAGLIRIMNNMDYSKLRCEAWRHTQTLHTFEVSQFCNCQTSLQRVEEPEQWLLGLVSAWAWQLTWICAQITGTGSRPDKLALRNEQGFGATMTSKDDEANELSHRDYRCKHWRERWFASGWPCR